MINRRNFFSKFSLLAFFTPFIPKLKSFLYDKNLELKSKYFPNNIRYCNTYCHGLNGLIYIYWQDENGTHDEIYGSEYETMLERYIWKIS